jgi:hypothetical protein
VPDEDVARLSPLVDSHLNTHGSCSFTPSTSADGCGPARPSTPQTSVSERSSSFVDTGCRRPATVRGLVHDDHRT